MEGSGVCKFNTISNNQISNNSDIGIYLEEPCRYNLISENNVINNYVGIGLSWESSNNTVTENSIVNNSYVGLITDTNSYNNNIYLNCFTENLVHVRDDGMDNRWDNGSKGNYWDNYTGLDGDDNGIGDIPYKIRG